MPDARHDLQTHMSRGEVKSSRVSRKKASFHRSIRREKAADGYTHGRLDDMSTCVVSRVVKVAFLPRGVSRSYTSARMHQQPLTRAAGLARTGGASGHAE